MVFGARNLNDNGSVLGLNIFDLISAVGVMIAMSELLRPLRLEFLSVKNGEFREDLYMRISTFVAKMPSLAERKEDIPELIRSRIPAVAREAGVIVGYEDLPQDFIQEVMDNPPEGNVRGINHLLSRMFALSPRDRDRKPDFSNWRMISYLFTGIRKTSATDHVEGVITANQLMKSEFDIEGPGFPGFTALIEMFGDKIMESAKAKYPKNRDVAAALKMSESGISSRLKTALTRQENRRLLKRKIPVEKKPKNRSTCNDDEHFARA
ncbi:hypothetical protein WDW86_11935 [Bdellovibrionota bacterium FG-2]